MSCLAKHVVKVVSLLRPFVLCLNVVQSNNVYTSINFNFTRCSPIHRISVCAGTASRHRHLVVSCTFDVGKPHICSRCVAWHCG